MTEENNFEKILLHPDTSLKIYSKTAICRGAILAEYFPKKYFPEQYERKSNGTLSSKLVISINSDK